MPVSPSQDDSHCLRTFAVTTAELTLDVGEKTVKTGGNDSESETKGGQKEADLTEFVFTSRLWVLWQKKSRES